MIGVAHDFVGNTLRAVIHGAHVRQMHRNRQRLDNRRIIKLEACLVCLPAGQCMCKIFCHVAQRCEPGRSLEERGSELHSPCLGLALSKHEINH